MMDADARPVCASAVEDQNRSQILHALARATHSRLVRLGLSITGASFQSAFGLTGAYERRTLTPSAGRRTRTPSWADEGGELCVRAGFGQAHHH